MKKIFLLVMTVLLAAAFPVRSQDAAIEERVNKLTGYLQDVREAQEAQRKQIEALAKEISSLREQLGQTKPDVATKDDLRVLADKIQEVDRKRAEDMENVAREIESLGKVASQRRAIPVVDAGSNTSRSGRPTDKGYEYEVKSGDTLSAIAAAYREQGIKVSVEQILAANPGLKPTSMKVGQKIFIPAPQQ